MSRKKGDAELIKRDVKTSQGHATRSEKNLKWSESQQPAAPKAKGVGREGWMAPSQPCQDLQFLQDLPHKRQLGAILGLKGETTGQNNDVTTWNPSFPPTFFFLPACREPLQEATAAVPRLSLPSSWIGVDSSEAHTLPNQVMYNCSSQHTHTTCLFVTKINLKGSTATTLTNQHVATNKTGFSSNSKIVF